MMKAQFFINPDNFVSKILRSPITYSSSSQSTPESKPKSPESKPDLLTRISEAQRTIEKNIKDATT
jgi:hypothetical protein